MTDYQRDGAYIATKYKMDYKKGICADILEVVVGEHSYNPLKDYLESCGERV